MRPLCKRLGLYVLTVDMVMTHRPAGLDSVVKYTGRANRRSHTSRQLMAVKDRKTSENDMLLGGYVSITKFIQLQDVIELKLFDPYQSPSSLIQVPLVPVFVIANLIDQLSLEVLRELLENLP